MLVFQRRTERICRDFPHKGSLPPNFDIEDRHYYHSSHNANMFCAIHMTSTIAEALRAEKGMGTFLLFRRHVHNIVRIALFDNENNANVAHLDTWSNVHPSER